ncbi:MAG: low affinity iron permease family protein [Chloroflexota bacterium]
MYHRSFFGRFSKWISSMAGHPVTFSIAILIILVWAGSGPFFGFSNTWQLIINTITTTVTFLMVFLIQHTQERDATAIQLKLDELIRAHQGAHNALLDLEELEVQDLKTLRGRYEELARRARSNMAAGGIHADLNDLQLDDQ